MQSKGAIRFFAIALGLVCLYQLSFTFVTRSVEKKAEAYAHGDPKKVKTYLDSVAALPVYNLLVKKYTYLECKDLEINLGLDLRGGMNVTLEVSVIDLVRSMANNSTDPGFNKAIEMAVEKQKNSQQDFVTLFGESFETLNPNTKLASIFSTSELQDRINFNSSNAEVLKVIKKEADGAIDRSFNILRNRIDKFGVTQPNIQKLGSGRILVELPGVKEPERVRRLLQGTAKLEFWTTYQNGEVFSYMDQANKILAAYIAAKDSLSNPAKAKTTAEAKTDTSKKADGNLLSKIKGQKDANAADSSKRSMEESAAKNPLFALLQPPLIQDEQGKTGVRKQGAVVGYVNIKDTAKVNAFLSIPQVKAVFPKELRLLWSFKPEEKTSRVLSLYAIKSSQPDGSAPLEGDVITDAKADMGQLTHNPEISMSMNPDGARTWKNLTRDNTGRSIAIVLDDLVYSAPNVQGEIAGGHSNITGNFDVNEAKDLANILKAGKLPAPARIVEEAVVGPSLGQEAIQAGLISFVIALLLVLIFMVFYYSNAGFVADIALFANIFFVMGVLVAWGAVLTLPGIAGIVLIIGMSVDANVLIYERIREEIAEGKGLRLAITDGYKNAYSSIIDSNVTTLLIGIILMSFGTGPIKGFAVTLVIGILTSLFSAIFITRLIFEWQLGQNKHIKFSTKLTEGAFKNIKFNFVGNRKYYYIVSGLIILAGIVSFAVKGFNFGVDFKGGRTYVIRFEKPVTTDQVRTSLEKALAVAPEVKTFGSSNQVKVTTTYLIEDAAVDADNKVLTKLDEGLKPLNNPSTIMSSQKVGPTIADDIKSSAVYSILLSLVVVFFYILIRFKKWQFSLGAVAALFHDVLIVLSFYTILNGVMPFSLEIDQAFIAAILTVMGYSITDTVVVFDRIREFLANKNENDKIGPVINYALNSTLSRTINTSLTIFFVLLAIFIFGGDVIRGFSFALLIGIVIGTYSSLCIATPIVIDFDRTQRGEDTKKGLLEKENSKYTPVTS
jgi:SecD/SecF fusion protein